MMVAEKEVAFMADVPDGVQRSGGEASDRALLPFARGGVRLGARLRRFHRGCRRSADSHRPRPKRYCRAGTYGSAGVGQITPDEWALTTQRSLCSSPIVLAVCEL